MDDYSYIQFTNICNPTGRLERIEYKWIGKSPRVAIGRGLLEELNISEKEKIIQIGPYRLKLINSDSFWHSDYIRLDYPFWWAVVFWYKVNRVLDLIYRRMIFTLAIWGLADYRPQTIPSWRDIKFIKYLRKR